MICVFLAQDVVGGPWRLTTGFDVLADYTGNVFLEETEVSQRETLVRLRPRIHATREGSRASASISYVPELNYYVNGTFENGITNFLNASGDVELIQNVFGVRGSARAAQSLINRDAPVSPDGLTDPDNVTDTYSLVITPYLLPIPLGPYAYFGIDTDIGGFSYSDQRVQDSRADRVRVTLSNGRYFSDFTWRLRWDTAVIEYEDSEEDRFNSLTANANYRFNRRWQLNTRFGYDDNDVRTTRDINGFFWNLGATYTPNSRASFGFGVGERFNESNYDLEFRYRHRHTTWFARYTRDLSTAQEAFLDRSIFAGWDQFGNRVEDPTEDPGSFGVSPDSTVSDTVYIEDRFKFGLRWDLRRTSLSTNVRFTRRDDLQIDDITEDWVLDLTLDRRFSGRSSVGAGGSWWIHTEEDDSANDYRQWSGIVNYTYRLSERTRLRLAYIFTIRNNEIGDDFEEDRISFLLSSSFQ